MWRGACLVGGIAALGVALAPPVETLSSALASAHMGQHLLLIAVAPPLLVLGTRRGALLRALPVRLRPLVGRWRRSLAGRAGAWVAGQAAVLAALHVLVLWTWHAGAVYDAALAQPLLHLLEHATFLGTALLAWAALLDARPRPAIGARVLVLFGLSAQSALLGLLLTFAPTPWYAGYADATAAYGLSRVADQQLAGVLMWVPGGVPYLVLALWLLRGWLREPAAHHLVHSRPG